MVRIEATRRPATAQDYARRETALPPAPETGRALAVLPAPRAAESEPARTRVDARPPAGFLAQLILSADPTLAPSRSERAQRACRLYAAAQAA